MHRCSLLTLIGIGLLAGNTWAGNLAARPNVLLIVSEDNSPQFGCYGDQTVPTPNVDKLAAEGVRFTNAYVTQAVCSPSRSTIYTGLYPHQNGQIGLATHRFTMSRQWPTLPTLLKAAGYRTGMMGKLHVLPEEAFPFDFRYDDRTVISFNSRDVKKTAEIASEFMNGTQPFFLMVNFSDAHLPFLRQSAGLPEKPLNGEDVRVPAGVGIDTPRLREHAANYYNCMSRLDLGIGMLLDALDASGHAKNTLVIYLSDHGMQFARGKVTSYELGLRVPLVVRWPGHATHGTVRDDLVSTIDLVPTICAVTGATAPANLPGMSFEPLLGTKQAPWREYLCAEWNVSHAHPVGILCPQRTIRDRRYKLIVNLLANLPNPAEHYYTQQVIVQTGANQAEIDAAPAAVQAAYRTWRTSPPVELYDLKNDPHEFENLAGRANVAEVQSRLLKELEAWREATDDPLRNLQKLNLLVEEHARQAKRMAGGLPREKLQWEYPKYLYQN